MIVRESSTSTRLQERYFDALEAYVASAEESALLDAYELGRQIMDSAGGVLDLSAVHQDAMEMVMRHTRGGGPRELVARRCHEFLDEALSPFEMAQRGFREANLRLMTVNGELAHQSAQLSAVIASINDGLVVANSEGAVTAANQRAAEVLWCARTSCSTATWPPSPRSWRGAARAGRTTCRTCGGGSGAGTPTRPR